MAKSIDRAKKSDKSKPEPRNPQISKPVRKLANAVLMAGST
jgi:hypothetical protein